eukprot:snap_masked-scaffold_15-processed-gene-5.11-mRNA-1 protein AED:1.00 eAED:1.00 QI:0/0/0/0/1/1/2/0/65
MWPCVSRWRKVFIHMGRATYRRKRIRPPIALAKGLGEENKQYLGTDYGRSKSVKAKDLSEEYTHS